MQSSAVVCWLGILRLDIHESFVNTVGMLWEKYLKIIKTKEDWNIQPASKHNIIIIIVLALHGTILNLFY